MAFTNNMTKLIDKIERRLELVGLQLPEIIGKDTWGKIIMEDSIPTFSKYFPHQITIELNQSMRSKREPNTYIIDEDLIPGDIRIIGFKDLNWERLINSSASTQTQYGMYGIYDGYDLVDFEDFTSIIGQADSMSLYNRGIYPEFEAPNKIRFKGAIGVDLGPSLGTIPITIFLEHPNLNTIETTKMESFERLARDDVATFLYGTLKYYDQMPTIFGGEVDLKLDKIQECVNDREQYIDTLESGYVSAANKNQPMIVAT